MAVMGTRPLAGPFFGSPPGSSSVTWPADWWSGCAAAGLNPDFSFSNLQYGVFNTGCGYEDAPNSEDEVSILVCASFARRGRGHGRSSNQGDRPTRGQGGGRCGGRPGKPPAPVVHVAFDEEETPARI